LVGGVAATGEGFGNGMPHQGWATALTALRRAGVAALAGWLGAASAVLTWPICPALAQDSPPNGGVGIVRDAETEALLQSYLKPLFKAAGIPAGQVQVFIVPDEDFNAFVADAQHMFVNSGAIIQTDTPNELIGVLAHETGHVAHQDTAKLAQKIKDTQSIALIASLLGVAGAVAGSMSGVQGAAPVGQSILSAVPSIAMRSLLGYSRAVESAADRSAVDYLNASKQSPMGLLTTLQKLGNQNLLLEHNADPYLQNHPLTPDRIAALQDLVKASPYVGVKDPPDLQLQHDLVRAKLVGFMWTGSRIAQRYPASDTSLPAQYARAISTYRFGQLATAQKQIDALIAARPTDPYFLELKGQELLETGNPKGALDPLRKAVAMAPDEGLIKILLGRALVANNSKALAQEAIDVLTSGTQRDPDESGGYRALAQAYGMLGNVPMAQLFSAEALFADGSINDAKIQAKRAEDQLPRGSPGWIRADDIVSYKPPKN
jgi:predicted Zn-dependent protease